jgi:pyrophosphatase PpaX
MRKQTEQRIPKLDCTSTGWGKEGESILISTALFDLDGTLLDTNELIIRSFLHTLEGVSPEQHTRETIIPHMGRPLVDQLRFFSGLTDVAALTDKYRTYNIENHDAMVNAFPHVKETLAALHAAGVRIAIVTSKMRNTTEMGLRLCGLAPYVESIVTLEDVEQAKPDPEGIFLALRELGAEGQPAVMVGDSSYDIEAAKRAGTAVGVSWSLKGREYIERQQPDYVIDDMRELLPIMGIMEA